MVWDDDDGIPTGDETIVNCQDGTVVNLNVQSIEGLKTQVFRKTYVQNYLEVGKQAPMELARGTYFVPSTTRLYVSGVRCYQRYSNAQR